MLSYITKTIMAMLFAAVAVFENTMPFAFVLLFAIVIDCLSAYDLNRRLARQHPGKVSGKFQSNYAMKMALTFLQVYSVVVLLYLVDTILLAGVMDLKLSNIAASIFCGIQLWSILENLSSANGAGWARLAQRILVDKTKRHLNIDLNEISDTNNNADADSMQQEDFPGYPNPRI